LLYARINDARLFSVPLAGGESTLVADAHRPASEVRVFGDGLDATHFYWLERELLFGALWRVPRQGGEASRLGVFEGLDFSTPVARSSDAMIAAGSIRLFDRASDVPRVGARLIPLDGSAPRDFTELARAGETVLAIDRAGVYWSETMGSYDANWKGETRVTRTPVDGASREPFWTDKPGLVRPHALWSDGDGWIASAEEPFDDGVRHQEIWRIEPNGAGHLLACDPGAGASPIHVQPALANDAVYVVTAKTIETGEPAPRSTWTIVELPR